MSTFGVVFLYKQAGLSPYADAVYTNTTNEPARVYGEEVDFFSQVSKSGGSTSVCLLWRNCLLETAR